MGRHTWAFIGVLVLIGTLAGIDLYLLDRIKGVDRRVDKVFIYLDDLSKRINGVIDAARGAANSAVDKRRKQLDEQERAIHEEMATLTRLLFDAAEMLQEFMSQVREEASHDDPAGAGRYKAGGGGASGGAPNQANLPDAPGEAGGAG